MIARGLRAVRIRARKKTTTVDPDARTEHIKTHMFDKDENRNFTSEVSGTRLYSDIIYLRTGSGWLYLATVIDLSTRMVDGHDHPHQPDDRCSIHSPRSPLSRRGRAIFRSDRGEQYTSGEFQKWCFANGVTQSMGAVGVCWASSTPWRSHFSPI
jgi:transposase InsO family protein